MWGQILFMLPFIGLLIVIFWTISAGDRWGKRSGPQR